MDGHLTRRSLLRLAGLAAAAVGADALKTGWLADGSALASTCKPIKGAAVDIWHCDASGIYSGFGPGRASRTFMRGIQRTNADGIATFKTVYPGWYSGRTVHIHVKVHVRGNVVHTGQLYFPDTVTDAVYRRSPYSTRPDRNVRNATDSVYRSGGKRSLLRLRRNGAGYVGSIRMGVHRS